MPCSFRVSSSRSESYALSPTSRSGFSFRKPLSRVGSTRVTSCGEALSVWRARGTEEPSENAMILRTSYRWPRLVFPTLEPLFWLRRTCRLCSTPRGLSLLALPSLWLELRGHSRGLLPRSISENADDRSGRADSVLEDPSRVLRRAKPTECRLGHLGDLARVCLDHLLCETALE